MAGGSYLDQDGIVIFLGIWEFGHWELKEKKCISLHQIVVGVSLGKKGHMARLCL